MVDKQCYTQVGLWVSPKRYSGFDIELHRIADSDLEVWVCFLAAWPLRMYFWRKTLSRQQGMAIKFKKRTAE